MKKIDEYVGEKAFELRKLILELIAPAIQNLEKNKEKTENFIRQIIKDVKPRVSRGKLEVLYAKMRSITPKENLMDYLISWLKEAGVEVADE